MNLILSLLLFYYFINNIVIAILLNIVRRENIKHIYQSQMSVVKVEEYF
jgi:hypothetical protein